MRRNVRAAPQQYAQVLLTPLASARDYMSGVNVSKLADGSIIQPDQAPILGGTQARSVKSFVPPTNVFAGTEVQIKNTNKVQAGDLKSVKEGWIHIRLTLTTAGRVRLIPAEYWIRLLEIYANAGTGDKLQTFYSDTMWAYNDWYSA